MMMTRIESPGRRGLKRPPDLAAVAVEVVVENVTLAFEPSSSGATATISGLSNVVDQRPHAEQLFAVNPTWLTAPWLT